MQILRIFAAKSLNDCEKGCTQYPLFVRHLRNQTRTQSSNKKMNFTGIIIGISSFLCIGLFHPIVIKAEYHFGTRCWWVFLLVAIGCIVASLFTTSTIPSTILGVVAFSSLWSILELFKQRRRVEKGWFPKNPNRKY